jgi:flagellar hook-associated protein 1 FlgK
MADLFSLLTQSGNSLSAHSVSIATAGHNVANANTPGYSRQIANLVANPALVAGTLAGVGTGVSVESITQARDQFVERQMPNALAAQFSSQGESDALQSVTALNPDLPGGLTSTLGAFYSALRTLAQNPSDQGLRQVAVSSSQALTRSFNQTADAIEDARTGLDAKIAGNLDTINAAARQLSDLNRQIKLVQGSSGQANDLMDKRQMAIDTLASLTGATPYRNSEGDVSMALPGGGTLVSDGGAGQLSAIADPSNGGHLSIRLTRVDGSGPVTLAASSLGGEIGGIFSARDGAMKTALTSLDSFAFNLATAANAIHQAGYAMDGTGARDLFTIPVSSSGAASQITVNSAIVTDPRLLAAATATPSASGDNRNILALIDTERQALAGGSDPIASLQQIVTGFGSRTAQAKALAQHDTAMAGHLTQLRDATAGVSLDEEMINLTKAQKAYEAVAKVITIADSMLDTLMNLK